MVVMSLPFSFSFLGLAVTLIMRAKPQGHSTHKGPKTTRKMKVFDCNEKHRSGGMH
jgi:hypothetical protein